MEPPPATILLCLFLLCLPPALQGSYCREAKCVLEPASRSGQQVRGIVRLRQCGERGPVDIGVNLRGFNTTDGDTLHGFHIHQTGRTGDQCRDAEGHYNPFGNDHGGPRDNPRHVGDLGNVEEDDEGNVSTMKTDQVVTLYKTYSVINRAIVVHAGADDLGTGGDEGSRTTGNAGSRLACCVIREIRESEFRYAKCSIAPYTGVPELSISGDVWIKQLALEGGMSTFSLNLQGFRKYNPKRHGFHVHENGDTGDQCKDAGGHYNPRDQLHGGALSIVRHVGDLGNIGPDQEGNVRTTFSDPQISLQGSMSILNRAIVIHTGEDDLGLGTDAGSAATGNAGSRAACCIVTQSFYPPPSSSSVLKASLLLPVSLILIGKIVQL